MKNIKFKYKTNSEGNIYAYARVPTNITQKLKSLLEDGIIPHKDRLYYPTLAYGDVVFWSYKGVSPKSNKQVEIEGCIDAIINEISIEYLDVKGKYRVEVLNDMFKSTRRNPKSIVAREEAKEQLSRITEPVPEPDPDEDEDELFF